MLIKERYFDNNLHFQISSLSVCSIFKSTPTKQTRRLMSKPHEEKSFLARRSSLVKNIPGISVWDSGIVYSHPLFSPLSRLYITF